MVQKLIIKTEKVLFYTLLVCTLIAQLFLFIVGPLYGLLTLLIPWAIARAFYYVFNKHLGKGNALLLIAIVLGGGLIAIYSQDFTPLKNFTERSRTYPTHIVTLDVGKNPSVFLRTHLACTPECVDLLIDGKFAFVETKDARPDAPANSITRWTLLRNKSHCWHPKKTERRDDFFDAANLWLLAQGACIVSERDTVSKAQFSYEADRKIQSEQEGLTVEYITPSKADEPVSQNTTQYVTVTAFPPAYVRTGCAGYAGISVCKGPMKFRTTLWQTKPYINTHDFISKTLGVSITQRIYSEQFSRPLLEDSTSTILEAANSKRDDLKQSVAAIVCSLEKYPNDNQTLLTQLHQMNYKCVRPN